MPFTWLIAILAAHCGDWLSDGAQPRIEKRGGDRRELHSLPVYYGTNVAMWAIVPAAACSSSGCWRSRFCQLACLATLPDTMVSEGSSIGLVMSDVRRVADGLDVAVQQGAMSRDEAASSARTPLMYVSVLVRLAWLLGRSVSPEVLQGRSATATLNAAGSMLMTVLVLLIAWVVPPTPMRESTQISAPATTLSAVSLALLIAAASCRNSDHHRHLVCSALQHHRVFQTLPSG